MQKIDKSLDWGSKGWDRFFVDKGLMWCDKDYRYLNDIFEMPLLSGSLLDVGCALGDGLSYLKGICPEVASWSGSDFSAQAIEICRQKPELRGVELFQHDIHQPLTQKFNNIICLQTLEHLDKPLVAINNLIDATAELLIVSVPYKNRRPDENHLWSFDEQDFAELTDIYGTDRREKNIFWVFNKSSKSFGFRPPSYKDRLIKRFKNTLSFK